VVSYVFFCEHSQGQKLMAKQAGNGAMAVTWEDEWSYMGATWCYITNSVLFTM